MKNIILPLILITWVLTGSSAVAQNVGLNVGDIAPEIILKDPSGKDIPLSSLRGNIVLVDFWASWCVPCRKENPKIRRIYEKYNKQTFSAARGFEIYSVSLDKNQDSWRQAISKDKLDWKAHVSDLKGWKSSAAYRYEVYAIPMNFLIDANGVILAKGLNSKAIEEALDQLVK